MWIRALSLFVFAGWLASAVVSQSHAEGRACYDIYGEVRDLGRGWAHIVVVENDCDYWLQCTVWTDVDPQPPAMITVGPSMSEKAQITRDSEDEEFKAFGTCRRK